MRLKERSIDILWNVSKLLEDPKRWTQVQLAEDENGCPVCPTDASAVKWSITGALALYDTSILAINALLSVSGSNSLRTLEMKATHPELLRILSRAMTWLEAWHEYATR